MIIKGVKNRSTGYPPSERLRNFKKDSNDCPQTEGDEIDV